WQPEHSCAALRFRERVSQQDFDERNSCGCRLQNFEWKLHSGAASLHRTRALADLFSAGGVGYCARFNSGQSRTSQHAPAKRTGTHAIGGSVRTKERWGEWESGGILPVTPSPSLRVLSSHRLPLYNVAAS